MADETALSEEHMLDVLVQQRQQQLYSGLLFIFWVSRFQFMSMT